MVTMLQPGAYAPTGESLEQKLLELGGRGSSSTTCTPISFIYGGTKDWMTSAHGARVVDTLRQRADADAASGGGGGDPHQQRDPQHTIVVLETSGHHVMLDDAVGFNEAVLAAADL
jgi:pimeloyl-ACP methyl ester carboxylesterase